MLDMAPTLMGLTGHDVPSNWQGRNLASAILAQDDDAVDSLPIVNFKPSWRGVYTRRYTFALEQIERTPDLQTRILSDMGVRYTRSHSVLYDRDSDPIQQQNLINSTEHIPLAMQMTDLTHEWCARFRDPFWSYKRLSHVAGEREDKPPIELITSVGNEAANPI